jgi:hypothetical protein
VLRLRLATLIVLTALVAGCGLSGPSSPASGQVSTAPGAVTPVPSTTGSAPPASGEPGASASGSTDAPSDTPIPVDSPTPGDSTGPSPEPSASGPVGAADACSGTQGNRDFFASVSIAVSWPVLCGVLPAGWYLSNGSYRLANGGKVLVSYLGPGGATLALSEGAFCADGSGCVPAGTDAGGASLGAYAGTLVQLDAGGYAIVVDRGANPSWLMETHGLDEATTVALGAALYEIAG